MPKSKEPESQEERSERFRNAVQRMIDAGELNPTDAAETVDKLILRAKLKPGKS